MIRRRGSRVALAAPLLLLVACGSGRSIIESGSPVPTAVPVVTGPPSTIPDGSTPPSAPAPGDATTVPGATVAPTTTTPLDQLPECPTDALAEASGTVAITVWHGMSGDVLLQEMERLTADYNASQSKVRVDLIDQAGYEEVIDRYLQSGQDNRPDVAQMPEYMVQAIVDTDSAVPTSACIRSSGFDTSVFIPGALNAYSTGGVQWSMPFNVSNPILFYNRKVFAAAGLDPDRPPVSLAEMREFSQQIVDSGAATYGIALDSGFDSGGGWYIEQWFAQTGQLYSDNENGRAARATQVLYDGELGVDLMTQLQSLLADGLAVDVGDNTSTGFDNLLKLADSTAPAAMTIATSASLGAVLNILQGGQFPAISAEDVGIGPMPGPQGALGAIVGGASLWMTDSGDPERIAASWDYITYMVGAQQQSEWSSATGYIAVRDDARDLDPLRATLESDPRFAVALDQLLALPDSPSSAGPILGPLREVRTVTAQGVAAIFSGADVQSSLTDAKAQADALIADYNARNA